MSVWLALPLKSLLEGKSRLAPILDDAQRRALLEKMFQHTLTQAAQFPGLDRTLVVSGCGETRARAAAFGTHVLEEKLGAGLNGALDEARLELRRRGASQMMIVHSDLPLLTESDLRRLAEAASANSIAFAPDRLRQGTNGLCVDVSVDFIFNFGPGSFALHLEEAKRRGLHAVVVETEGLAFDVDLPEDLAVDQAKLIQAVAPQQRR